MQNKQIRDTAKHRGIFLWQIAARIGLNDSNFSRKLRQELPYEERDRILAIIEELSAEREGVD